MPKPTASLWHAVPADIAPRIERCLAGACEQRETRGPVPVFFRADDIAVPGKQFFRLMALFTLYRIPLCLSVVPAWLTAYRWRQLKQAGSKTPELWCWHQHGWRHVNHEKNDRKQEFGPSRPLDKITADLLRGRQRLESLLGKDFYPVFVPPWNRCGPATLKQLKSLGYHAISRIRGSVPPPPSGLPDFQVNVDLHTRREGNPHEGWHQLLNDLGGAVTNGRCGIMIHHRLMNVAAFDFLEILLKTIVSHKVLHPTLFKGLTGLY